MARTQEEMIELEAAKQDLHGSDASQENANVASMSRDITLLPIETSPRKPRPEKVSQRSASCLKRMAGKLARMLWVCISVCCEIGTRI